MNVSDDTPLDGSSPEDILADAYTRFKRCQDWEHDARENIRADMKFAEGDSRNNYQWPENITTERQGAMKPLLTNNMVRQHNLQIVNDARQNKPGIEIRATGDGATYDAAKVFEALVRHIEYQSDAQDAYDSATYHQVYGGIGYCRLITKYSDDDGFNQDLMIRRVDDPLSIYLDPDIKQYDGSDARFGVSFSDFDKREFARKYPAYKDTAIRPQFADVASDWVSADKVRVAEFYRKVDKSDWLFEVPPGIMPDKQDGGVVRGSDLPEEIVVAFKAAKFRSRRITKTVVEHFTIAGGDVIARTIWPGQYIPIARFVGEETVIDGKLDRKGHTRSMISAQQMHNFFYSAAVEHVALQNKSPYLADIRSIEGYEEYWRNSNTKNYAFLPYNGVDDNGTELPPPRREPAPEMAQAFIQGLNVSSQLIMDVSGQHQANLGEPSNEKSGVAIQQRQRQGDNATAHYIDHQAQAVRFLGRMIVDVIPKIYDTKRVFEILDPDGSRYKLQIDPAHPDAHEQKQNLEAPEYDPSAVAAVFNPSIGRYAVIADIGPSFATKRQDAFNAYSQLLAQNQELTKVAADLMFKNADFPGADELAQRLRRTIPPNLLSDDTGPPPAVQQLQQQLQAMQQHAQQVIGQADQETTQLKAENTRLKADISDRAARTAIEDYKAETARMAAVAQIDPTALIPIIREQVSQMLGQPALPVMQAHQVQDEMHAAAMDAATTQMQPPQPQDGQAAQPTPAAPGAQNQAGPA